MTSEAPVLPLPPGGRAPDACWWIHTADGVRLRAARWAAEAATGHAILLSGRTEFLEKMSIPAADLVARGLSVVSVDWRGQGLSDRLIDPAAKGHIGDFADFQTDLDAVLADPQVTGLTGPRVLMAHSMGGAIAGRALMRAEIADTVDATVLSAPMFGIAMSAWMRPVAWLTIRIGLGLGGGDRWPPFGDVSTPYVLSGFDDNLLTNDRAVWDWMAQLSTDHPEIAIAMPTLGWFAAADAEMRALRQIRAPGHPVLCLLGADEKVVDPKHVQAAATRLNAEVAVFTGGRHELLIEADPMRGQAWRKIDAFLSAASVPIRAAAAD